MIDPITPALTVPWRGKTYQLQLTLGALCGASRRLGIPILEGGDGALDSLPELAQRAVILYAILHRKFPDITVQECEDALFDPALFARYESICADAMKSVVPAIQAIKDARPQTAAEEVKSSGGDSGQSESSTSA
jgi:hypothetical protein